MSASVVWTKRIHISFDTLNEKLIGLPVLVYAGYLKPFKIHTDASTTGLGDLQYHNQDGKDRVVAYTSRCLKLSEKNYPAHKLEFLALKFVLTENFEIYICLHGVLRLRCEWALVSGFMVHQV